ncbi:cation diffusion facilitator family transporter [Arcticibacter pallidicorallinus]|uniref:Cation diffusion facilitator family transporter n=1 Tax=Arcticibacter pallidicorallinus TaxID=1259464 RepID=A0A2T0TZ76_9SPHI|nr:cation diffusion facilitator family transporter [Arcticibacter pallidicorallinus]PRY50848.1 cation diffusion facilitator family transporter [Arcticibacter pallidicorallinus]
MKDIDLDPSIKAIRTTQLGIAVSIVLVVVKALAGHFGHSYALIADATETAADIVSSFLLWLGLRYSLKPADARHPYGHGKAEPLAAVVISLFLIAAAVWIAYNAISFINTPHQGPEVFTLWILIAVIAIKEFLYRYVMKVGKELNSQAVKADAFHHRSDAITSAAAFIGILIAVIGGSGYEGADDWAAIIAAALIVYNAFNILKPAFDEIMDSAPSGEIVNRVKDSARSVQDVVEVEKCYVRKMGLDYFIDLHILVDANLTVSAGHTIAHMVKDKLMKSNSQIKGAIIHVEPYVSNAN